MITAKRIRNFGKRIGSKGWVCRAASGSVRSRSGLAERGRAPSLLPFARGGRAACAGEAGRGASVRGRAQLGCPPRLPGSAGDQQPT